MKRTGPTNENLQSLIADLKKLAIEKEIKLFKRLATELEKSTRNQRVVNLSRISRYTKADDVIVVPGKVLGSGLLDHSLTIYAYKFSDSALEKINGAKAKANKINDLIKEEIKGMKIKIIG